MNKRYRGGGDEGAGPSGVLGSAGYGGYEPTSKVVSVVNSVEMGGGEKYLVVSQAR